MLTKEQKAWLVNGFCDAYTGCGSKCPIRHLCDQVDVNFGRFADDVLDECIKIIAPNLIDEPVRHGLWVVSDSPAHLEVIKCSECNTMYQKHWMVYCCNFCPNCGARMRGY